MVVPKYTIPKEKCKALANLETTTFALEKSKVLI